jgi:hypothetical protein
MSAYISPAPSIYCTNCGKWKMYLKNKWNIYFFILPIICIYIFSSCLSTYFWRPLWSAFAQTMQWIITPNFVNIFTLFSVSPRVTSSYSFRPTPQVDEYAVHSFFFLNSPPRWCQVVCINFVECVNGVAVVNYNVWIGLILLFLQQALSLLQSHVFKSTL